MSELLEIEIAASLPAHMAGDFVVVFVFKGELTVDVGPVDFRRAATQLLTESKFSGKEDETLLVYAPTAQTEMRSTILVGCGARGDAEIVTLQRGASSAVRAATNAHASSLTIVLPDWPIAVVAARAIAEGVVMGQYRNDFYRKQEDISAPLQRCVIVSDRVDADMHSAVERGRVGADCANWTRALADEPGAALTPAMFALRAEQLAAECNMTAQILDEAQIQAQGLGGLWGVGKGSDAPPRLIVLRYEPKHAIDTDEVIGLVGKGITFDTGGISIKHGLDMYEMKSDMTGGATVLGAMRALAKLNCRRRIVGVIPAAENMPSGRSIKPGDVIRTYAGKTIEVVDTDAEGRLVLADGIAYAKHLGATKIVDLATLTGSIIIALGSYRTGLFSNDDGWANEVLAAAERAGEPVWRMPVTDDYKKKIESPIADFKNYGGKPDAIAAALLLSKFAGDTPWVHLDIAGTSWYDEQLPYAPKGASGIGVRTIVELLHSS